MFVAGKYRSLKRKISHRRYWIDKRHSGSLIPPGSRLAWFWHPASSARSFHVPLGANVYLFERQIVATHLQNRPQRTWSMSGGLSAELEQGPRTKSCLDSARFGRAFSAPLLFRPEWKNVLFEDKIMFENRLILFYRVSFRVTVFPS